MQNVFEVSMILSVSAQNVHTFTTALFVDLLVTILQTCLLHSLLNNMSGLVFIQISLLKADVSI